MPPSSPHPIEHQESAEPSRGRRLFDAPVLRQDWEEEAEEGAAQYWELILDLLLVAAASSITDQFKEHLNGTGLGEFTVFYFILINSWLLYTHHITTRFEDSSLVHSLVLFVYCLGFGISIVNTSYEQVQAFCWGSLIQRASILWMLGSFSYCLPRARYTCAALAIVIAVTSVGLLLVALFGSTIRDSPLFMTLFWLAAGVEFCGEWVMVYCIPGRNLVPINIEQTKERLGALELIMLGETILSVTLIYRELKPEIEEEEEREAGKTTAEGEENPFGFYYVLGFSFLLIFMFLLLYFHMQPSPEDHAFRRSRFHGVSCMMLHKIMGLALLVVGTSVKLVVETNLLQEEMPRFATALMGYGVGFALLCLLGMRYLHYGGKDHINFGRRCYYYGISPAMDLLGKTWWCTVSIAALLPFVGIWTGFTYRHDNALMLTGLHALLMFLVTLAESIFTHTFQEFMARYSPPDTGGENQKLVGSTGASYKSTS